MLVRVVTALILALLGAFIPAHVFAGGQPGTAVPVLALDFVVLGLALLMAGFLRRHRLTA